MEPTLVNAFVANYKPGKQELTTTELLEKLANDGLLQEQHLRNFMILKQYPDLLAENEGQVMQTIYQLSDTYSISDRQVQNVLYRYRGRYKVG